MISKEGRLLEGVPLLCMQEPAMTGVLPPPKLFEKLAYRVGYDTPVSAGSFTPYVTRWIHTGAVDFL